MPMPTSGYQQNSSLFLRTGELKMANGNESNWADAHAYPIGPVVSEVKLFEIADG